VKHHDLEFELDCAWWAEAGMEKFAPLTRAYAANSSQTDGRSISEVSIEDVRAVSRKPGIGIFSENAVAITASPSVMPGWRKAPAKRPPAVNKV